MLLKRSVKAQLVAAGSLLVAVLVVLFTGLPMYVLHPASRFETVCNQDGNRCVTLLRQRDYGFDTTTEVTLSFDARRYPPWSRPANRVVFAPDMNVNVVWTAPNALQITVSNGGQDFTQFGALPGELKIDWSFNG